MDTYDNGLTKQTVYYEDCIGGMRKWIPDRSIHLVVTSIPYWDLKDYGHPGQIGFGQSLQEFLSKMNEAFVECYRVLSEGRRMVINVSDGLVSNARRAKENDCSDGVRGNFVSIPLHAYIIMEALKAGFHYNSTALWSKYNNCTDNSGVKGSGIVVLGSYLYPPNAHVTSKVEYVLIFRKKEDLASKVRPESKLVKERSKLTEKEWKTYTDQIWSFPGSHNKVHPATFPLELPKRCIKMWTFVGETVIDPFLGSGTTLKACQENGRNGIGFEISEKYRDLVDASLRPGLGKDFVLRQTTKQDRVI